MANSPLEFIYSDEVKMRIRGAILSNGEEIGMADSYALAKANGYTGTETEWINAYVQLTGDTMLVQNAKEYCQNVAIGLEAGMEKVVKEIQPFSRAQIDYLYQNTAGR